MTDRSLRESVASWDATKDQCVSYLPPDSIQRRSVAICESFKGGCAPLGGIRKIRVVAGHANNDLAGLWITRLDGGVSTQVSASQNLADQAAGPIRVHPDRDRGR